MTTPNLSGMLNEGNQDAIIANTRVRALNQAVTFTDSSGTVTLQPNLLGTNYIDGTGAPQTLSGNSQIMAANTFLNGVVVLRPNAAQTFTTDSATNILNACLAVCPGGVQVGDYLPVLLMNDSANAVTMAMGSGVTSANSSTNSIAANTSRYCQFRFTNATLGSAAITMFF